MAGPHDRDPAHGRKSPPATYTELAGRYHTRVFTQIATAETRHLDAIRAALAKPLNGLTAPRLQHLYTNLLNASQNHLTALGNGFS